jgi:hypothetical protein
MAWCVRMAAPPRGVATNRGEKPTRFQARRRHLAEFMPDTVVQRAVNGLRSVPVRSVLFEFSGLPLQCAPLRSAVFTHKMSHCVSGSNWASRDLGGGLCRETQSLAVLDDELGDGLIATDLARRLRLAQPLSLHAITPASLRASMRYFRSLVPIRF